jgi:flagellar hook-associated protein 1 FlgK
MLGLFGTLDMAARSLSVQQEATEVAGQNLANASNAAYARQQLVVQSATPLQTSLGQEGTGVDAIAITEVRNSILDNQIQAEASVTGSLSAQQSSLQEAEAYLDEQMSAQSSTGSSAASASSSNGLAAALSGLFDSFQSLSTNPSDLSQRQAVIAAAQQLAGQFNQVSSQLGQVQSGLNASIQSDVATANQDLSGIASLNQQIIQAQAGGGTANDLVDQREQLIENLAGTANLSLADDSNGGIDVSIGGVTMVSGENMVDSLTTADAANGNATVQDANSSAPLALTSGSIEGEMTARDGALAGLQGGLDTLASQLITNVNQIYSAGYDLNGNTGQNFFVGSNAATIGVSSSLASDPTQFQASAAAGATGDNTIALSLAQLANQNISALDGQTLSQSYAQNVANLGDAISSVNDQLNNSQAVSQMLTTQRASASGVNIDQEMTNLLQFQKAYEASAELVTTVNQMLQALVTMKTT